MKKNCPGKKSVSSFSDQLYENKTDPFAQANNARARSDSLKQRSRMLSKCLCGVMLAPYHRKGDRSRRGNLIAERKCMKRWRSGGRKKDSNPYTPDKVSTRKRGLKSAGQEISTKILISWQELKNQFLSFFVHR